MKVYINGCSHSTSYAWPQLGSHRVSWPFYVHFELNKNHHNITFDNLFDSSIVEHLYGYKKKYWLNQPPFLQYSIPNLYEKEFNNFIDNKRKDIDYFISDAGDGKGNDAIFYETWNRLQDLEDKGELPDFCIVQWSGHSRTSLTALEDSERYSEIPDYYKNIYGNDSDEFNNAIIGRHTDNKEGAWVLHLKTNVYYSTPFDKLNQTPDFSQLILEPYASFRTLNHMIILQDYLESKNIDYVYVNYFEMEKDVEKYKRFNKLNLNKFVTHPESEHPLFDTWLDYVRKGKYFGKKMRLASDEAGHPNVNGKKLLCLRTLEKANELYDFNHKISKMKESDKLI